MGIDGRKTNRNFFGDKILKLVEITKGNQIAYSDKGPSVPSKDSHMFQVLLLRGSATLFDSANEIFSMKRMKFSAIQS